MFNHTGQRVGWVSPTFNPTYEGMSFSFMDGAITAAMESDLDAIIKSYQRWREDVKFDLVALLRDQDDGACQIWYQPLPDNNNFAADVKSE